MKLFHIIAVRSRPYYEVREEHATFAEYERTFAALSRHYETVFVARTFDGKRDKGRDDG